VTDLPDLFRILVVIFLVMHGIGQPIATAHSTAR
jgi:hypothetical protein